MMRKPFLALLAFGLLIGSADAADWPDAVVLCAPVTCGGCGSAFIRAGNPSQTRNFTFQTTANAKQVCDKLSELATSIGLTVTRAAEARLVIHGKIDGLTAPSDRLALPPATCTKPDAFPVSTMLSGKDFTPARDRKLLDAFNLTWAVEENWSDLELIGKVTDQTVRVLGKWKDCFFNYTEMPIGRYFELLRD